MSQPTTVSDCMRRNPLTIAYDSSLVQAIETIMEYKLTGLTVVDADGRPVGVLTELDCLDAVLTSIYNEGDPEHAYVRDAMSTDIPTCKASDSIVEVAQSMLKDRQRRNTVIEDGKLVGQVSSSNILWALMEHARRKRFGR